MSAPQTTYNRSLDEILGFNTTAKSITPIVPPRKLPGSRSSENNSVGSTPIAKIDSVRSTQDRPPTRHGRSSQSESSSSSKIENNVTERKPGILSNRSVDVWNREEETHEPELIALANGPRRSTLTRSIQQPSTILEQDKLSSIDSSSSPTSGSSYHDEFLVEPKPEQFETTTQPFKLSSSSSGSSSSSSVSAASQRTYSTKAHENNDSLLNSSIKLPSSASSAESRKKRGAVEEPFEMLNGKSATNKVEEIKSAVQLPKKTDLKPLLNEKSRARPDVPPRRPQQRPKSSAPQPRPEIDIQRAKLKSSMSTRQLLNDNSPNYNLWLQRTLANDKKKRAEEKAKQEGEERKKAEQKANAEKAFERWKVRHDERERTERQRKRTELEETERQKKATLEEKRRNAEKTFEHWKKTQDEKRRAERMQRMHKERERAQSVELQKRRQRNENEKAYQVWCETFNQRMREDRQIRDAKEQERRSKLEQDRTFKDTLAKEAYDLWLEMKRKEKIFSHSLAYKILDYNAEAKKRWPVPWIPTTPTVPRKFVGTGNRRRTLDKPLTIVQRRAKSVY